MGSTDILLMRFCSFTIEIKSNFVHFLSAGFLLGFFFRLYIIFLRNISTQKISQILLIYESVFKCNKSSTSL